MHFVVDQASLYKVLDRVKVAFHSKINTQILSCVKIEAKDGSVSFTTTTLESEASDSIECNVISPGVVAAQMDTLFDIVKQIDKGSHITIKVKEGEGSEKLVVECQGDVYEVHSHKASEFPSCFQDLHCEGVQIEAKKLKALFNKVSFAASQGGERRELSGLYITTKEDEKDGNCLCCVATDGHRLALAKEKIEAKDLNIPGVIVSKKIVDDMSKILDGDDVSVLTISKEKGTLVLCVGKLKFSAKLMDSNFPNYQRVIPTDNVNILETFALALCNKLAAAMTTAKGRGVQLLIRPNEVELVGKGPTGERSDIKLKDCSFSSSEELKTTYNPKFLQDAIVHAGVGEKKIRLCFKDAASQVLIQPVDDDSSLYVVMPMKNED